MYGKSTLYHSAFIDTKYINICSVGLAIQVGAHYCSNICLQASHQ